MLGGCCDEEVEELVEIDNLVGIWVSGLIGRTERGLYFSAMANTTFIIPFILPSTISRKDRHYYSGTPSL